MAQIIACSLCVAAFVLIFVFYKKLPPRVSRALTASMVFIFGTVLLVNFLRSQLNFLTDAQTGDTASVITALGLAVMLAVVSFLTVFLINNEEKERKIFFHIALIIFVLAYVKYLSGLINGAGSFPSHLCRQLSYAFPIVYFSDFKWIKKYMLPYFTYASLIGAIVTLFMPENILQNSIWVWGEMDTVLTHAALLLVPAILLATKQVKPVFHHIWQFTVLLGVSALFALFCNWIDSLHSATHKWGNGMYLTEPAVDGFPTWLFAICCILFTTLIVVGYNWKKVTTRLRHNKKTETSD